MNKHERPWHYLSAVEEEELIHNQAIEYIEATEKNINDLLREGYKIKFIKKREKELSKRVSEDLNYLDVIREARKKGIDFVVTIDENLIIWFKE